MAADAPARRLEWSPGALDAYLSTLARIAAEDAVTARQFGTPAARRGERRHAIPGTGHVINYRVTRGAVRIQLWYRARRHTLRR